jgi:hypothetical protein
MSIRYGTCFHFGLRSWFSRRSLRLAAAMVPQRTLTLGSGRALLVKAWESTSGS